MSGGGGKTRRRWYRHWRLTSVTVLLPARVQMSWVQVSRTRSGH
ncbi:MAG: hypothetical protein ACREDE_08230 [Thermoplasmata archaeon]